MSECKSSEGEGWHLMQREDMMSTAQQDERLPLSPKVLKSHLSNVTSLLETSSEFTAPLSHPEKFVFHLFFSFQFCACGVLENQNLLLYSHLASLHSIWIFFTRRLNTRKRKNTASDSTICVTAPTENVRRLSGDQSMSESSLTNLKQHRNIDGANQALGFQGIKTE